MSDERVVERLKSADAVLKLSQIDGFDIDSLLRAVKDEEKKRFLHYKPYAKQKEFHNSLADERILSGGNQCGKSQPLDEPVLTPSGWVKMGDIEVGDYVIGSDGEAKEVVGVYPQGEREIYEFEFYNGAKVRCDKEHLWTFVHKKAITVTANEAVNLLAKGEKLIVPFVKPIKFNIQKVPIDPYLFGVLLGDGSFRNKKITLTNVDEDIIEYCRKAVERYNCRLVKEADITYRISSNVNGKNALVDILREEFDLMGCDSHKKFIPDLYKYNSERVRLEILRGLIDTDGAITESGRIEFYSVNEQLCRDVYEIVMSLGIRARVSIKHGRYKGNKHTSFRVLISTSSKSLSNLKRKAERQVLKEPRNKGVGVKSIRDVGKVSCQCIYINSLDHLYVTNDYILTHNTIAGCMEMSFHATGRYPDWWEGHRIEPRVNASSGEKEINLWVIGTDSKTVRDSLQSKIIGSESKEFTDGCLHSELIDREGIIKSRGVTGLVDTVYVRHKSGCMSKIQFRSYEQGRENLQSATVDACYCDEEPPADVLGEIRARLGATGGFMFIAFTPLNGMTPLVQEFWSRDNPDKFLTCLSVYDSPHYTPEKLRKLEGRYSGLSEAERQARMNGIPTMGSGVVYPIDNNELYWDTQGEIPKYWERIGGLDFGRGEHPTALVWLARDPSTDTVYLYDALKTRHNSIAENASLIRKRGEWIPFAYPHDLMRDSGVSVSRDKLKQTEGYRYKQMYEDEGVNLTPTNAKTQDGSTRVEVGIVEIRQRMLEGRFKVAKHLSEWFKEKDVYRYAEDGKPIKEKDDLLDATRYAMIMLRYAVSENDAFFDYGYKSGVVDNTKVYDD